MADMFTSLQDDSVKARFWARVDVRGDDECWEWLGAFCGRQYGVFSIFGKRASAHRVSLCMATGESPDSLTWALHSCDNPKCVNPHHLRWGGASDNSDDATARNRWHRWNGARIGTGNPQAKINYEIARNIREAVRAGKSQREVGEQFNVSQQTVSKIVRNKSWNHPHD